MPDALLAHEPLIRLAAFAGVLVVMVAWELVAPRRDQAIGRRLVATVLVAAVVAAWLASWGRY